MNGDRSEAVDNSETYRDLAEEASAACPVSAIEVE